jgi:CheY-like chemotaxis protein
VERIQVAAPEIDHPGITGARILVVDDNLVNVEIVRRLLDRAGIQVTTAVNGLEAVAAVTQAVEPFDVVLMDVQMPVMDGLEATRIIRQQKSAEELPVIAFTAMALPEDQDTCLKSGMNDHLAKPTDILDLYDKLIRWIRPRHDMAIAGAPSASGTPGFWDGHHIPLKEQNITSH